MAAIDTSALVTNLGAYSRQANSQIFTDMLLGLEPIFNDLGIVIADGIADEEPLMNATMGDILQPGGNPAVTNFTDNALTWDNRLMKVRPVKADLIIYPQLMERIWLTQFRTKKGTMNKMEDMPFYEFVIQQIIKKAQEELFMATFIANRANSTANWTKIIDGLIPLLKADVAAGKVSQVGSGNAITSGNVVAELEAIGNGVSDANAASRTIMQVSPTTARWYVRSNGSEIGRAIDFDGINAVKTSTGLPSFKLRASNTTVIPNPALSQSLTGLANEAVIVSIENNIIVGTDSLDEKNKMRFQEFDRGIKVFMDFKWGVQYALANTAKKPIFVNAGAGW